MNKTRRLIISILLLLVICIISVILIIVGRLTEGGSDSVPSVSISPTTVESATPSTTSTEVDTSAVSALLSSTDSATFLEFSEKYEGQTIVFDGCISYVANHGDYNTRYDILLMGGDYVDENTANTGPQFKFEDVNTTDLGIKELYLPSYITPGTNVHIVAEVEEYKIDSDLFFLDPIQVTQR